MNAKAYAHFAEKFTNFVRKLYAGSQEQKPQESRLM